MIADKRVFDLRREAGESAAILASVEAQLAAEGDGEPFYWNTPPTIPSAFVNESKSYVVGEQRGKARALSASVQRP
jgi:hypothetical protein